MARKLLGTLRMFKISDDFNASGDNVVAIQAHAGTRMALLGALLLYWLSACSGQTADPDDVANSGGNTGQDGSGGTRSTGGSGGDDSASGGDSALGGQSAAGSHMGGAAGPTEPGRDLELVDVEFSEGLFVAVGVASGDEYDDGRATSYIISSTDGAHWNERYLEQDVILYSVATSGDRWLSVGWTIWNTDAGFRRAVGILGSSDGLTWAPMDEPSADSLSDIVWTGSKFVLAGQRGNATKIWTSPDGDTWTAQATPDVGGERPHLAVHEGTVVLGAYGLAYSLNDGVSWEKIESPEISWVQGLWTDESGFAGAHSYDCCFGEVPGGRTDYVLDSADGQAWTSAEVPSEDPFILDMTQAGETVVGLDGWDLVSKVDDEEWVAGPQGSYSAVVHGAGVFVAVGAWDLKWSADGVTWEDGVVTPRD